MPGTGPRPDAAPMINATEEFWDFERASYDDELDAWRERTAVSAVQDLPDLGRPRRQSRRLGRRSLRRPAARAPRQRTGLAGSLAECRPSQLRVARAPTTRLLADAHPRNVGAR
jgi:hypothetical protein